MFIANEKVTLHRILKEEIQKSDEVIIASAFITDTDIIYNLLNSKKKFTLIFRLSHPATPDFLKKLLKLPDPTNHLYFFDQSYRNSRAFHPKIYLFKKSGKSISAIIGSSNFTNAGLDTNYEFNILINEKLEEIDMYLKQIVKESSGILSKSIIDDYKKWYIAPKILHRYKMTRASLGRIEKYKQILEKWRLIKGILEDVKKTQLPFTYVYDAFCHHLKVRMIRELKIEKPVRFDKEFLIGTFQKFLSDYFYGDEVEWRINRHKLSMKIRQNLSSSSSDDLRLFFMQIHCIKSGSGSGIRTAYFKNQATKDEMQGLLTFIIDDKRSMEEKYAIGLIEKKDGGEKIDYVADSGLGEIIGWLIPEHYPIINGKFHDSLEFFKV
ncbi:MAG: NgoFVII family restriction endonuclease [Bacteroidetes bacterium]|jgi:HKD family nuclease|nr:NgoFVII family restriction endonuclease [Bacteroidota bacterium]